MKIITFLTLILLTVYSGFAQPTDEGSGGRTVFDMSGSEDPTMATNGNAGTGLPGTMNTLPAMLISFTGAAVHCSAHLTWKTGIELNSGYCDVEESTDGAAFTKAGTVVSQHLSNGALYTYDVDDMTNGIHYFRLKIVDITGYAGYSKTIMLTGHCSVSNAPVIAPNPVNDVMTIYGLSGKDNIAIFDHAGRQVMEWQSDEILPSIPVSGLARGVYFVRIVDENGRITISRMLKQ